MIPSVAPSTVASFELGRLDATVEAGVDVGRREVSNGGRLLRPGGAEGGDTRVRVAEGICADADGDEVD
jgi:hypothetical protein